MTKRVQPRMWGAQTCNDCQGDGMQRAEESTIRSCADFSYVHKQDKIEFWSEKEDRGEGKDSFALQKLSGGPNINCHPLAKQQGPEEPLPRRIGKAHRTHVLGEGKKQQRCQDFGLLSCSGAQGMLSNERHGNDPSTCSPTVTCLLNKSIIHLQDPSSVHSHVFRLASAPSSLVRLNHDHRAWLKESPFSHHWSFHQPSCNRQVYAPAASTGAKASRHCTATVTARHY